MTQTAQISQQDNRWVLSGDVLIDNAADLLKQSLAFDLNEHTVIDFGAVNQIDTAAISLILEWRRRAAQKNWHLKTVKLPANLSKLTQLYGVADYLSYLLPWQI